MLPVAIQNTPIPPFQKNCAPSHVLERQERGAWHIHVAVSGRQEWKILRSIWISIISKSGTDGAVNDSIGNRKKAWLFRQWGGKGRAMRHPIAENSHQPTRRRERRI